MGQLALVAGTAPGNPPRNDLASLGDEVLQPANVLIIDQVYFFRAELADLAAAEPPALDGLLGGWNR
jgi:hypothetical protein